MKKRITAALLVLCMILSIAQFNATTNTDIATNQEQQEDDAENLSEVDATSSDDSGILYDESDVLNETDNSESLFDFQESESVSENDEEELNDYETVEVLDYETSLKVEKDLEEMEENEEIIEHGGTLEPNAIVADEQQLYSMMRTSTYSNNGINICFYDSTINDGKTALNSIDWNAIDGTENAKSRTIKAKIDINVSNGYLDSERGDIKLIVTNPLYGVFSDEKARKNWNNAYMDVNIDISANYGSKNGYSWYCINDDVNNTSNKEFTFFNENKIQSGTTIRDSITITYTITPKSMNDRMDEVAKRWMNYGEATRNLSSTMEATMNILGSLEQSQKRTETSPNWPNNYPKLPAWTPEWSSDKTIQYSYMMWKYDGFEKNGQKPKYLAYFIDSSSALAREDSLFFDNFSGSTGYDIYGNITHFERPLKQNPPYNIGGGKSFIIEHSAYWIGMYGWQGGAKGFKVDIYPIYMDEYKSNVVNFNYKMTHNLILSEDEINTLKPIDSASTKDLIKMNLFNYHAKDSDININKKYLENSRYPRFINYGVSPVLYYTNSAFLRTLGKFISVDLKVDRATANNEISLLDELGEDGFPVVKGGASLGYLFGKENVAFVEKVNKDTVDGLFLYDNQTDTYSYNSKINAAKWNNESGKIELYNAKLTDNAIYNYGGFFPFNDINLAEKVEKLDRSYFAQQAAIAIYKSNENGISEEQKNQYRDFAKQLISFIEQTDKENNENWYYNIEDDSDNIYNINFADETDYFTGISQQLAFYQPVGGIVESEDGINGMFYEFSGTNEFYLYIDNKLTAKISGGTDDKKVRIDFETGTVSYYDNNSDVVTSKKEFSDIFGANSLNEKGTFPDYSVHNMKIFSYDKSAGNELLGMKFNLQLIQNEIGEDGIIVNGVATWDREPNDIDTISINIYRSVDGVEKELYDTIDAKKENGWKYAIVCPGKDENGKEYQYWVEEKTNFGDTYIVMYFDDDRNFINTPEPGYYNIYNALNIQMNELKGSITWSEKPEGIGSIKLDIYQVAFDGKENLYASVSTSARKNWNWSITAPEEDFDGNKYTYYVVSSMGELYEAWYYDKDIDAKTKVPTIGYLNVYNKLLKLEGEITWNEVPSEIESVNIDIIQTDVDGNSKTYKTINVTKKNSWKWSSHVPVVDSQNRLYSYSVKHDSEMCEVSYYGDDTNSLSKESKDGYLNIYNKSLNLEGEITWNQVPDDINNVTITVYQQDPNGNTIEYKTIDVDKENNWKWNLFVPVVNENGHGKEYLYSVKHDSEMCEVSYYGDDINSLSKEPKSWNINVYNKSLKIGGKITWNDVPDGVNKIEVEIYQTNHDGDEVLYKTLDIKSTDNWEWELFVPLVDNKGHGNEYLYKVREPDSNMYGITYYSDDINSSVYIPANGYYNIHNISKMISGEITWDIEPYGVESINLRIYQVDADKNINLYRIVTALKQNEWKYSLYVPYDDENNIPYYYYMEENDTLTHKVVYYGEAKPDISLEEDSNNNEEIVDEEQPDNSSETDSGANEFDSVEDDVVEDNSEEITEETTDENIPEVPGYGQSKPGVGLYNAYNYNGGYWTEETDIRIQKKWLYRPPIGSVEMELRRVNLDGTKDEFVRNIEVLSNGTRDWENIESVIKYEKYGTEWKYYVIEKTDSNGDWGTYYKNEFNGFTSATPTPEYLIVYNYKIAKIKGNTSRLKISKILLNDDGNTLTDEDWEKIKLDKNYHESEWLAYFEITNAEHPELKYNVSVNVMEGTIIKFLPAGSYYIRELDDTWQMLEMMAANKSDAGEFNYDEDSKIAYFTIR